MTGVFFISHIFNDFTLFQYKSIQNSLLEGFKLIWVSTKEVPLEFKVKKDILFFIINKSDRYFDKNNNNLPNNSEIFRKCFNKYFCFDFYWFIEYDVCINSSDNSFKHIFEYYHNSKHIEYNADIICDHTENYDTQYIYNTRYPYYELRKNYEINFIDKDKIMFGFFTICRLSNEFLNKFNRDTRFHNLYFEWGLPTFAKLNKMYIVTFKNIFAFELPHYIVHSHNHSSINSGSNSWNKDNLNYSKFFQKGCIIHPVKNFENYNKYIKKIWKV